MGATSVGEIGLDLVVNHNSFEKQMTGVERMARRAGAALAGAFATKKLVDFGKKCLDLGSDLSEVQNVADVTFPAMTARVDEFAKSALNSFGLSETMAKRYTGTFGAMAKAFGFAEKDAFEMSSTLTGLAGDVASFYNISQNEAYTKLKSVFTGETESLKDLGVVMTQAALDQYALANGFGKTTSAMSEAEKVALRYQFVQEKLSAAQGDFARTSGSWANQCRILSLQVESVMATVGQGLINLFTPIIKTANVVIGKIATLANAFKAFTELITGNQGSGSSQVANPVSEVGELANSAADGLAGASSAADGLANSTKGAGAAAEKAAKQMRTLMGFDKINKVSSPADSGSGSGGSAGGVGSAGGIGATVNFGNLAQGETVVDQIDNKFTQMFENIKKLCDPATQSLKRLWNEGLSRLGDFTWTALNDFYKGFLVPIGKWTLGTGIPRFVDVLNNGLMKVNFQKINDSLKKLWRALAPFAIRVGEGLLWLWENALVPLGTWTANEVVPRFIDSIRIAINIFNKILVVLKPLFIWFWENVLQKIAKWSGKIFTEAWDGINNALGKFSDWCEKNPGIIRGVTVCVSAFFAAWKATELLSFIEQSGGVVAALSRVAKALFGTTTAKLIDKAETVVLTAMYAKDFVVSVGETIAALAKQVTQFALSTAAKIADKVAQAALTAATVAWNAVCAAATAATTAFGAAISFLTSPIGIAILAIAGLIAAGIAIYKNWDVICAKAKEIWGHISEILSRTWENIKRNTAEIWESIKTGILNIWEGIKTAASTAFESIKDTILIVWERVTSACWNAWNGIQTKLSDIWRSIKTTAVETFEGVKSSISDAWETVKTTSKEIWDGIFETISDVWDSMCIAAEDIGENIKNAFRKAFEGLVSIIKTPVNGVIALLNGLIRAVNSLLATIESHLRFDFTIPNPFGGTIVDYHWQATLPRIKYRIPALADGGYVKKNTPRLALIGDNRHYGEIVAPENKMQAMVDEAVRRAGGGGGITKEELETLLNRAVMRIISALASVGFNLDGEQVALLQRMAQTSIDRRFNTVEIT